MAAVQLADVIIPAVYETYTSVNNVETNAFVAGGIAVTNPLLNGFEDEGGILVQMPYWKDLDATVEPNYSTDDPTQVASPQKIQAGIMQARKANLNNAWSAADLVSELAGSDPMQRIKDRTDNYWLRNWQYRLLAVCSGILAANVAQNASDMVIDLHTEDGKNATNSNLFTRLAFTGAIFTSGDHADDYTAIAVHSVVYKRMIDNNDIAFIQPSQGEPAVPTFLGKRVIVDDMMPVRAGTTSGYVYTSILYAPGAIGYGEGNARIPVEVKREALQGNGGGVEILVERKSWIMNPFGWTWTNTTLSAQSPTLANLRLPANWQRTLTRKLTPIAFLLTNG